MARITLFRERLEQNYRFLDTLFAEKQRSWAVVTKLLCGNPYFIHEVLRLGVTEVHDSRLSNLKALREQAPSVQTVYIKPPPPQYLAEVVAVADVSLNTELSTIQGLSEAAQAQGKLHKVLIMVELGDLREGVLGDHLVDFYQAVFTLPGIEVIGLGTNLNCLSGVMPSVDKLVQLALYRDILELRFGRKLPWLSGGTTVTVPLLVQDRLPAAINHFRIGELLFFGINLVTGATLAGMRDDVFELTAQIIELSEKPTVPEGELAANPSGEVAVIDPADYGRTAHRALLDIGLLDVQPRYLLPQDPWVKVVGASSDMLVVDLADNPMGLRVGDRLRFRLTYMGALSIINSDYVEKSVMVEGEERLFESALPLPSVYID